MRHRLVAGLIAVLVGAGLSTPQLPAQDRQCGKCYDNSEGTAHVFGDAGWGYMYSLMDCNTLNSCHTNSQYGSCGGNHYSCYLGSQFLLDAVDGFAAAGDIAEIYALVARYPSVVGLDGYGRVLVMDCNGMPLTTRPISLVA